MTSRDLPSLTAAQFRHSLESVAGLSLSDAQVVALHQHYQELRRWNRRLSLIGPGTIDEILGRHYGESLAALPLVSTDASEIADIGSGAGFPGFILAAMLPTVHVTLIEPRQRKWAFLQTVARHAALPVNCLNARVAASLPDGLPARLDLVTARALKIPAEQLEALAERLTPEGRMLFWVGDEAPDPPRGWQIGRELRLPGTERRRLLEFHRMRA